MIGKTTEIGLTGEVNVIFKRDSPFVSDESMDRVYHSDLMICPWARLGSLHHSSARMQAALMPNLLNIIQ